MVIGISFFVLVLLLGIILYLWRFLSKTTRSIQSELAEMTSRVSTHLEQTARLAQQAGEGTVKAMSEV
ncbi:MAG: hypothetical protein HY583_01465 [Candidatus Omnitrophica bacterium]|nr:hypothetical protein [Candidatus Omnitrophota bacterium]